MERRPRPRWWPPCLMQRASTRPSSMAALSTPTGLTPGLVKAIGWLLRLMSRMEHSSNYPQPSPSLPTSMLNILISTVRLTKSAAHSSHCVQNIPFYGFAAVCLDHPEVQALIGRVSDRRLITYGFSPQAEVRAEDLAAGPGGMRFDVILGVRGEPERRLNGLTLPMFGQHNVQNALAAIAVANEMNIDDETIGRTLATFEGVKRRFTKTGEANGITIIDDYGHHPVEIAAVLKAARTATRQKVVAVVQPHRFTRLQALFEDFCLCFNDADHVIVADVYAAGEDPIKDFDRDALVHGLKRRGHRSVHALEDPTDLAELVARLTSSGDLVVCLGAGTSTNWANALPAELAALGEQQAGGG